VFLTVVVWVATDEAQSVAVHPEISWSEEKRARNGKITYRNG
jgi:hypothetical protein